MYKYNQFILVFTNTFIRYGEKPLLSTDHEQHVFQSNSSKQIWADRKSQEAEKQFDSEMLSGGHGIAFDVNRLNGRIPGLRNVSLKLTCYSNVCGDYSDTLRLEVVGLPVIHLPVRARVVGVPLKLLKRTVGLTLSSGTEPNVLKWLAILKNNPVTRVVQLQNSSAKDTNVNWRLKSGEESKNFSVNSKSTLIRAGKIEQFSFTFQSEEPGEFTEEVEAISVPVHQDGDVESNIPLSLVLTGKVETPSLSSDQGRFKIICSVTDDYSNDYFQSTLILTNDMSCALAFNIEPPETEFFQIIAVDTISQDELMETGTMTQNLTERSTRPNSGNTKRKQTQTMEQSKKATSTKKFKFSSATEYELNPQTQMRITIRFDPISYVSRQLPRPEKFDLFADQIQLCYSGGHKQCVDIVAQLHYPVISVTPQIVDFGDLNTFKPEELPFWIHNNSRVSRAKWRLHETQPLMVNDVSLENPKHTIFELSETKGLIAQTNKLKPGKTCIYVKFQPKGNERYEQNFDLMIEGMEALVRVTCKGRGRYEEFHDVTSSLLK
jgi:hypothetical protein